MTRLGLRYFRGLIWPGTTMFGLGSPSMQASGERKSQVGMDQGKTKDWLNFFDHQSMQGDTHKTLTRVISEALRIKPRIVLATTLGS